MKYLATLSLLFVLTIPVLGVANDSLTTSPDSAIVSQKSTPVVVNANPVEELKNSMPEVKWSLSLSKVFWAVVIFLLAFLVIKYVTKLLETIAEKSAKMRLNIKRIIPIFRIFGWTFIIYIIIEGVFAPPIETLIAVTGAAGIAIGFASQDILKNIFGGIMILFDRPFQVGDKIEVGSYYGEVLNIGLRSVRIVTPDDSLVSIPNNEIVNQSVSNSNAGETNCQVVAEVYLPLTIDVGRVKQIAYEAAVSSKYTYLNKPIAVILKNEIHQGRSMLKMRLKAYVLDIRYEFPFMSEMTEIVVRELIEQNVVDPEALSCVAR